MEYRRDPSSPTKRRKAEDVKVDAKDRKYYLYVRLTHPGVEVWSIETKRTNADGDSTLFRDMITLQLPQTFVDTYGFKLFCRRRQSRNNNSVAVYQSPSSVNQCRYVFIRIVDESNPSSREAMAELLCKHLDFAAHRGKSDSQAFHYSICSSFDQTSSDLKIYDFLLDENIVQLVDAMYDIKYKQFWALNFPCEAIHFFPGPPYCDVAKRDLGYRDHIISLENTFNSQVRNDGNTPATSNSDDE